jgi:uncharacterized protein YndB with AHSA1/START domain
MAARCHVHEEVFPATPERVFALLHTPSAIRGWWGASRAIVLVEPGGTWTATWGESEDDPDYVTAATIGDFDPPRRMVLTEGGLAAIPKGEFDSPPDPKTRTPFAGLIDEVAFFNVALTPKQDQTLAGQ